MARTTIAQRNVAVDLDDGDQVDQRFCVAAVDVLQCGGAQRARVGKQ